MKLKLIILITVLLSACSSIKDTNDLSNPKENLLVSYNAGSKNEVTKILRERGFEVSHQYENFNYILISVNASELESKKIELLTLPNVIGVQENKTSFPN